MSGPAPVTAAGGGIVFLVAEVSTLADSSTPIALLAGVLGSVVALLGWVVRRQQAASEAQVIADREEREVDRKYNREERERIVAAFRVEMAEERLVQRETNDARIKVLHDVICELQRLREDQRSGMACRFADGPHRDDGTWATARPRSKPDGTRGPSV